MIDVWPVRVDESRLVAVCRRRHVRELCLFGSAARGEASPDSDIDLLVEFEPGAEIGLLDDYAALMEELADLLGRKVDLVSKRGLKPMIRDEVVRDSRLLYAARCALPSRYRRSRGRKCPA